MEAFITCSVRECEKQAKQTGLCWAHYCRKRRHGDVNFRARRANGEGSYRGSANSRKWFTHNGSRKQEAALVAELALGKPLPSGAVVHHIDGNPSNCANDNLVICEGQGLHNIIHGRTAALISSGDARSKPCRFCHEYDQPGLLVKNGTSFYHRACNAKYQQQYRKKFIVERISGGNHESL